MLRLRQIAQLGEAKGERRIGLLLAEWYDAQREFLNCHGLLEKCDGFLPFLVAQGLLTAFK